MHFDKNCLYLLKSKADRGGMRLEKDHVNEEHSRGRGRTEHPGWWLASSRSIPYAFLNFGT